jgi:hypothetical protein
MLTALERFEEQYIKHPFLFDKQITRAIKNACDIVHDELNKLDKARPKWLSDDRVLTNIEKIISNRVGLPYDVAKLKQVYIDGAERYEKEIPPGYKDVDKDKNDKSKTRKFGDLVIWYQIIDKAKEEQKPIIFVTDEQKEDWWWKEEGGRNMGARFELKKEMFDKTGMMLHMYQSDQFIEHSREHLNTKFGPEFIKEIKKAREILSNDTEQYVGLSASSVFNNILEESGSETLAQRVVGAVDASLSMGEAAQSIEPKHPENNDGKTTL